MSSQMKTTCEGAQLALPVTEQLPAKPTVKRHKEPLLRGCYTNRSELLEEVMSGMTSRMWRGDRKEKEAQESVQ